MLYQWWCRVLSAVRCGGDHIWRVRRAIARWDRNGDPAPLTWYMCERCYLTSEGYFEE